MNKELTPLEAFKRFRNNIQWLQENVPNIKSYFENEKLYLKEDLDIIETALKRLEKLQVMHANALTKIANDRNKLKALEIIKKNFIPYAIEMMTNGKVRIWIGHDKYFDVTKEEYELLAGVFHGK